MEIKNSRYKFLSGRLALRSWSHSVLKDWNGQKAATLADFVLAFKQEALRAYPQEGLTPETVTVDSPVPFCIHKMWLELYRKEHLTVVPSPGGNADDREPAYVLGEDNKPVQVGEAMSVHAPIYRTVKTTGPAAERVQHANEGFGIRQPLAGLASKLRDPRFAFLFRPGKWLPQLDGKN